MKCRIPVKTITRPALFATSITFLSFIEPPGWIIASIPTSASSSIPSEKGKKASDAATEFVIFSGINCKAFWDAILQLSSLLGCPAPIPMVDLLFAKTIALDLTNLQILNANFKLLSWIGDGFFLVTIFSFLLRSMLLNLVIKKRFLKKDNVFYLLN